MATQLDQSDGVRVRKIENGYLLSWVEVNETTYGTHVEYYAPSLPDTLQRLTTLFQGQ